MATPLPAVAYPIGTTYKPIGKNRQVCTVVDVLRTYNSQGELVNVRYVATHEFAGQTVTEREVVAATIARGLMHCPHQPAPVGPDPLTSAVHKLIRYGKDGVNLDWNSPDAADIYYELMVASNFPRTAIPATGETPACS